MESVELLKQQPLTDKQAFTELFLDRKNSIKNVTIMNNGAVTHELYLDSEAIRDLYVRNDRDYYITLNDLKAHKRNNNNVIAFNGFMIDIDYRNIKTDGTPLTEDAAMHHVRNILKEKNIFQPSMIFSSGRGLWLVWKIEKVVNGTKKINQTWKQIQSDLVNAFSGIGADAKVKAPSNMMRFPGSVNQKNHRETRLIEYTGNTYTLRNFIDEVSTYNPKQNKKQRNTGKINHVFNEYNLYVTRYNDIIKFIELRNYDLANCRNVTLFLARNFLNLAYQGNDNHDLESEIEKLNNKLKNPVVESELRALNKDNKQYFITNDQIVNDLLEMTPDEQTYMKTIIGNDERNRRIQIRNKKYYQSTKEKNQNKLIKRNNLIMKLVDDQLTNSQILEEYTNITNESISLSTLKRIKKQSFN